MHRPLVVWRGPRARAPAHPRQASVLTRARHTPASDEEEPSDPPADSRALSHAETVVRARPASLANARNVAAETTATRRMR